MIFDVRLKSDKDYKGHVRIHSLEELKLFMEFNNASGVLISRPKKTGNYELKVMDNGK